MQEQRGGAERGEEADDERAGEPRADLVGDEVHGPATTAAAGSVSSQAATIRPAIPQRTSAARLPTPAPMTPPEVTCVVESG